jgi:hypothetical protein
MVARREPQLVEADAGFRADGHAADRSAPAPRVSTPTAWSGGAR